MIMMHIRGCPEPMGWSPGDSKPMRGLGFLAVIDIDKDFENAYAS